MQPSRRVSPRRGRIVFRCGLTAIFAAVAWQAGAASAERSLFNEAEQRFRGGNYAFALEAYEDFLERYPLSEFSADATYRVGVAQVQLGRYNDAVATFEEVQLRHRGTRYLAFVNFWAGVALYELEQFDRASASLGAFVAEADDPDDSDLFPRALLYLALADIALGDLGGAAAALERLRERAAVTGSNEFGIVLLGYVYAVQGRHDELLRLLEQYPPDAIDPRWRFQYLAYRAEAFWQLERYAAAQADYTAIAEAEEVEDGIASVALRRLFIAAERRGDFDRMDSVTLRAELRFRDSPQQLANFWLRLGIENHRRGSHELARFFLKRAADLGADSEVGNAAVLYLAETYLSDSAAGGLEEAAQVLASNQLSDGGRWPVVLRLGDVMLRQEDYAGAAQQYESFIATAAADPAARPEEVEHARYLLAYVRYRQGRYEDALREVRAIAAQSDAAGGARAGDLRRLQTVLLWRTGDTSEAERSARDYVDRFPDDIPARVDHMRLLYRLEQWQDLLAAAEALSERVPALRTRDPRAYLLTSYLRGLAYVARGEHAAAADALAAVARDRAERQGLGDIVPYAQYYRAAAHYRQGAYAQAGTLLADLERQFPGHELQAHAAFLAGQAAFSTADYVAAAASFLRAAGGDDRRAARAGLFAGRSLANAGDLRAAERQYRAVAERFPRFAEAADATFELAGVLAQGGRLQAAERAYGDVLFKHSASPLAEDAAFRRAELLLEQDSAAAARDAFAMYRSEYPAGRFRDGALYWGGVASSRAGEPQRAVLLWELLIDEFPDSTFRPNALLQTAEGYASRNDYQPAIAYLSELAGRYRDEPVGRLGEARLRELRLVASGASEEEASLMAVIGSGGVDTREGRDAMLELARIYVFDVDQPKALALAMLMDVAEFRDDPETAAGAEFLTGEYYRRTGDPVAATDHYLEAALLAESDRELVARSMLRAAEVLLVIGRRPEATGLVERLQESFPGSDWAQQGAALLREGS